MTEASRWREPEPKPAHVSDADLLAIYSAIAGNPEEPELSRRAAEVRMQGLRRKIAAEVPTDGR